MANDISSNSDLVVLVDREDNPIGLRDKLSCHEGRGILHRAVSVFIFSEQSELLVQRRHPDKTLWGNCWSNSCCTHPFMNEAPNRAAERRVQQELGLQVALSFVYKFEYHATWTNDLAEHELCSVFCGTTDSEPTVNDREVVSWQWQSTQKLDEWVSSGSTDLTPWFKQEWLELRKRGFPQSG